MQDLPPRRSDVNDPNLDWQVAVRTLIILDGHEQIRVTAYDCDEGWVEVHKVNEAGNSFIEDDKVVTERLHGSVTVAWRARE